MAPRGALRFALKGVLAILALALASELVLQAMAQLVADRDGQWREGARYRVLAMGDSHTWGSGVARADAYPAQLQRALDAREPGVYSVINRGLPGMSTAQLRNRFAVMMSRYRPDAIVIWCGANNRWNHAERDRTTTPTLLWLDGWLTRLRTYRLVRIFLHDWPLERVARERARDAWDVESLDRALDDEQRFTVRHDGVLERITHEKGANDDASLFDRTLGDLDAIAAMARAAGIELVLVTYPIDEDFFMLTNRAIREVAKRHRLPLVESPAALARIPREEQVWEWALHPDARLYGEVVADLLPTLVASRGGPARGSSRGCTDALAPLGPGFGRDGPHGAHREVLANPLSPDHAVSVFIPSGVAAPVPLVIFAHANGNPDPASYAGLIRHVVSRGHALVYPSHQIESKRHADRYGALWAGVGAAVEAHRDRFDLGRIGLVGHSYGAGALLQLAHRALVDQGWGSDGAFLFSMAPWYALGLEERDLAELPGHLKALFLVFEDDEVTDHRIAIAQRDELPDGVESDHLMLRTDRRGDCELPALHSVPQSGGLGGRDDAFDARAVYRLFDALGAYAFHGDALARRVALGRGDPAQVAMGSWSDGTPLRPLAWSARPAPARPESDYMFPKAAEAEWRRYGERSDESPPERAPGS